MEGMYWDEFRRLIERNKRPWSSLRYYRSKDGFTNTVSICDESLPRRKGVLSTAAGAEADHYRDSYVCNCGYLDGWVPLRGMPEVWNEAEKKFEVKPVRGMRETLVQLVAHGCVEPTNEVKRYAPHVKCNYKF